MEGKEKPSVLILGGTGFIGRNLVCYLQENDLAKKIRVTDKVIPAMAWLSERHMKSFSKVEFKHANLINQKSVSAVFRQEDGRGFDYIFNCAAETKLGQTDAVYKDGIVKLSCNCAREAVATQSKRYIELSSAYMQDSEKEAATEDMECKPWQSTAKHKLDVERQLAEMNHLDYVIIRPSLVYGEGCFTGITRRLVIASIYKYLKEKMQLLWSEDLKINTVHISDLVRAMWFLCCNGEKKGVYNVSDKGDSSQGSVTNLITEIFNINHDYLGTLASSIAKISLDEIAEVINEKHTVPWGHLCEQDGINNTPLSPLIHQEHLVNRNLHVNGSKIEKLGFKYEKPVMTVEILKEIVDDFVKRKLFPACVFQE